MGFSRHENSSGLSFPSPGDLPDPGLKPSSSVWQADSVLLSQQGRPGVGTENCGECEPDERAVAGVSGMLL